MRSRSPLPIEPVLPELTAALERERAAVLVAPPGAGKSTQVPLALLEASWLKGQRILMLEPRRLAARSVAGYMASLLGERVGERVGYRMRGETRVGPSTRIEVITEGILTRVIQNDPGLEGVGLVIFDEFHERHLASDLGLALAHQVQRLLRPDLRLLVMSATLEAEPVARLLGGVPVLRSEGRTFPVETHHVERPVSGPVESAVARIVAEALARHDGDVLVFLPGAAEIRRAGDALAGMLPARDVRIVSLHGSLPPEEQERAIAPGAPGERRVILSTPIAETSLTVEGVRVVVDSGLARAPRFSPRTGLTRLETVVISQAEAEQRRGRAGRLGPGVCYRLWTEAEHRLRPAQRTPEILAVDLAPLALELALWGVQQPDELAWLDPPPAAAYQEAIALLVRLGACDAAGRITAAGKEMAALGIHPRLAHMVLRATPLGLGGLACDLAALLSERDLLRGNDGPPDPDLRLRVEALRRPVPGVSRPLLRRIRDEAVLLRERSGNLAAPPGDPEATGLLLAFAFPDRIGRRRGYGRFLLSNGRGASLGRTSAPGEGHALAEADFIVVADLDDQGPEARIHLAAPVAVGDLEEHFREAIQVEETVEWDDAAGAVKARRRRRLGHLTLDESPLPHPDPERVLAAMLEGIRRAGLAVLPWSRATRQLQQRILFMRRWEAGWPDASDEGLLATLEEWLAPYVYGMTSRADLARLDLRSILLNLLTPAQRKGLDEHAPTHWVVPSGSRLPIDYSDPESPVLAVRIQEMFGARETPRIAGGRVPLTLHLLSPAHRPVQVTRDLAGFWRDAYFEVRKELRGRYPKHPWPDDPAGAPPTARIKRS